MLPVVPPLNNGFNYRGLGPYFAGSFLLPVLSGIALDSWLHTAPGFLLLGAFVGFLAVIVVDWVNRKELRN